MLGSFSFQVYEEFFVVVVLVFLGAWKKKKKNEQISQMLFPVLFSLEYFVPGNFHLYRSYSTSKDYLKRCLLYHYYPISQLKPISFSIELE